MDLQASDAALPVLSGPSSPQHAIYKPLDEAKGEIRLVELQPGSGDDAIAVTLFLATIHKPAEVSETLAPARPVSSTPYEAISYTWDETPRSSTLILNGHCVLMPSSAVEVLRAFRSATTMRVVWIDAVSINQQDIDERASQVAMMGEIYEAGSRTIAWLGDEDEDTATAATLCNEILHQIKEIPIRDAYFDFCSRIKDFSKTKIASEAEEALLYSILDRRWFTRAWALQEASLAQSCTCFIGTVSMEWRDLMALAYWLAQSWRRVHFERTRISPAVMASGLVAFFPSRMEVLRTRRHHISDLLSTTQYLCARDPRDNIYSLLGMVDWTRLKPWGPADLQPDYRMPFRQCVSIAVRIAIFESSTSAHQVGFMSSNLSANLNVGRDTDPAPWPSWVRMRSAIEHFDTSSPPYSFAYAAHNGRPQKREILYPPVSDTNIICSQGLSVDIVQEYTSEYPWTENEQLDVAACFQSTLDMTAFLLGDADEDKMIEPGDERLIDLMEIRNSEWQSPLHPARQRRKEAAELMRKRKDRTCEHRRFFKTKNGRIGIGPTGLQKYDRVVVIFGSKVPFVLSDRGYGDVLVGPCVVRGIMQGEAVREMEARGCEPEIFEIH